MPHLPPLHGRMGCNRLSHLPRRYTPRGRVQPVPSTLQGLQQGMQQGVQQTPYVAPGYGQGPYISPGYTYSGRFLGL